MVRHFIHRPQRLLFAVLASAVFAASLAEASSLKEQRFRVKQEKAFSLEVEYTNELCGSAISAMIDWETLSPRASTVNANLYTQCGVALSAIEKMCLCGHSERVQTQITQLRCSGGDTRALSLSSGELSYQITADPVSDYDFVLSFLGEGLAVRLNEFGCDFR